MSGIRGGMLQLAPFPLGKQNRAGCLRQLDTHGRAFRTLFREEMQGLLWLCGAQCAGGPGGLSAVLGKASASIEAYMRREPPLWPGWGN